MRWLKSISLFLLALFLLDCSKVPITGRKQLNLLPESQMISLSAGAYSEFLSAHKTVPSSNADAKMVQRVGSKISKAVELYMKNNGMADRVAGFKWEVKLVQDNTVNAWCMPGGKIVVYTGIMPIAKDETGLAVVMGHEVAHAIARHGNERMSQGLAIQAGGIALDVLSQEKPDMARNLLMQSYGIGSTLGSLAFSRQHETEADKLGLVFMAMAGYNPKEAPAFWQRMSELGGAKPPEFLSTHPSDATRIKNINAFMPEAMEYYKP